jgi:hypothetical protein
MIPSRHRTNLSQKTPMVSRTIIGRRLSDLVFWISRTRIQQLIRGLFGLIALAVTVPVLEKE